MQSTSLFLRITESKKKLHDKEKLIESANIKCKSNIMMKIKICIGTTKKYRYLHKF